MSRFCLKSNWIQKGPAPCYSLCTDIVACSAFNLRQPSPCVFSRSEPVCRKRSHCSDKYMTWCSRRRTQTVVISQEDREHETLLPRQEGEKPRQEVSDPAVRTASQAPADTCQAWAPNTCYIHMGYPSLHLATVYLWRYIWTYGNQCQSVITKPKYLFWLRAFRKIEHLEFANPFGSFSWTFPSSNTLNSGGSNSFQNFLRYFLEKMVKIIGLRTSFGVGAPLGNPGSTTAGSTKRSNC